MKVTRITRIYVETIEVIDLSPERPRPVIDTTGETLSEGPESTPSLRRSRSANVIPLRLRHSA